MLKRYIALSTVVVILLAGSVGRVGYIIFSGSYTASQGYNSYSVTVDVDEPQLYYRNGEKINNNVNGLTAVIRPVTNDLAALNKVYSTKQVKRITSELSQGYPVVHSISTQQTPLKTFETHRTETSLSQFISRDSSGFLKHIKEDYKRELKVSYHIDARDRLLAGDEGTSNSENYFSREGYIMTFDKHIQQVTVNASKTISKGCVLVFDAKTAEILACVSKPSDTYVNKAVQQYSVGSVFKIVLAACALENNVDLNYYCNGTTKVGDTFFSCQNNHAHRFESLESALANSCNCYFANLALDLGAEKIISTAKRLGFDSHISFCDNWQFRASYLPTKSKLKAQGELALFGFGQGKLTSTPLQLGAMLCAVANNGKYRQPTVIVSKRERNDLLVKQLHCQPKVRRFFAHTFARQSFTALHIMPKQARTSPPAKPALLRQVNTKTAGNSAIPGLQDFIRMIIRNTALWFCARRVEAALKIAVLFFVPLLKISNKNVIIFLR